MYLRAILRNNELLLQFTNYKFPMYRTVNGNKREVEEYARESSRDFARILISHVK